MHTPRTSLVLSSLVCSSLMFAAAGCEDVRPQMICDGAQSHVHFALPDGESYESDVVYSVHLNFDERTDEVHTCDFTLGGGGQGDTSFDILGDCDFEWTFDPLASEITLAVNTVGFEIELDLERDGVPVYTGADLALLHTTSDDDRACIEDVVFSFPLDRVEEERSIGIAQTP